MPVQARRRLWLGAGVLVLLLGVGEVHAQSPGSGRAESYDIMGRAVYDKVDVGNAGLETDDIRTEPIRSAAVEITHLASGRVVAWTETGPDGYFFEQVAEDGPYRIRVFALLSTDDLAIVNPADGSIWSVAAPAPAFSPVVVRASESSRVAGAFNILDTLRRANAFVRRLEPVATLEALTVLWSPQLTDDTQAAPPAFVGSTWFDSSRNLAVILGDRLRDSDEYDDDVILHEYAHFLAARFSRDDSIGGPHGPGDVLDPRVAWSEGWANFFSGLVREDPSYRDSRGRLGRDVLEYDLESNLTGTEPPGYWSERTVHALLWDLADAGEDSGETIQLEPGEIWGAFRRLADAHFVYLEQFLDALVETGAADAAQLEQVARLHSLNYVAFSRDRLTSFPKTMEGDIVTGELNSWSERRANLGRSAHLYSFYTSGGLVTIDLAITGLGAARNSTANDLDLLLRDEEGALLRMSGLGGNGEPERIATFLPEGTYVVEIRSFFTRDEAMGRQYNSGAYRLTVSRP